MAAQSLSAVVNISRQQLPLCPPTLESRRSPRDAPNRLEPLEAVEAFRAAVHRAAETVCMLHLSGHVGLLKTLIAPTASLLIG
jgi:hypothetical protein